MIGVISDTHGLLRPEALDALRGAGVILHAGDIGPRTILDELELVAPVYAVRGNCDHGEWAATLPETHVENLQGVMTYMRHDLGLLDLNPQAAGFGIVVSGHSHRPEISERAGVMYLNPGSAGPRRFSLPITVARLDIEDGRPRAEIVELSVF